MTDLAPLILLLSLCKSEKFVFLTLCSKNVLNWTQEKIVENSITKELTIFA